MDGWCLLDDGKLDTVYTSDSKRTLSVAMETVSSTAGNACVRVLSNVEHISINYTHSLTCHSLDSTHSHTWAKPATYLLTKILSYKCHLVN